jgi:hypothetical protein
MWFMGGYRFMVLLPYSCGKVTAPFQCRLGAPFQLTPHTCRPALPACKQQSAFMYRAFVAIESLKIAFKNQRRISG